MKRLKVMIALKLCLLWERFWCVCVLDNRPNRGWYLNLIMHGWFDGCRGAWAESKNRWHLQRGWHRWRRLSLRCLPVVRSELHCPREFEKGGTCLLGKLLRSNRLKPTTNNLLTTTKLQWQNYLVISVSTKWKKPLCSHRLSHLF